MISRDLRVKLFAVAVAIILVVADARAGTILVDSASGTLGAFTMTNMGVSMGEATILITGTPNINQALDTVNGVGIPADPVSFGGPVTLLVKPLGGGIFDLALSPPVYLATIGAPILDAQYAYNLTTGAAPIALPDFFNASGLIKALLMNANPLYDFSEFANGMGTFNATFTATAFTGVSSFTGLFVTPGAVATGNASFSQEALTPEPKDIVISATGFGTILLVYWWKMRRKRPATLTFREE